MVREKGFSLIELLVVIVVLMFVIVAMISAVDPLEQIRKARDIEKAKDAAELLRGYARYYGTFECYPWDVDAPDCSEVSVARLLLATEPDFSGTGVDYQLISQGFLKKVFAEKRSIERGMLLVSNNEERKVSVCFEPESKKGRRAPPLGLSDDINQNPVSQCADVSGYPDGSCFVCMGL